MALIKGSGTILKGASQYIKGAKPPSIKNIAEDDEVTPIWKRRLMNTNNKLARSK